MKDPIFTKEEVMWLQDKVLNALVPAHYILDTMLENREIKKELVESAYESLMELVELIRSLRYEHQ